MKAASQKSPIRLSIDVSAETLQARREWGDILKVLKEKDCQPRILYLAKLSFKIEKKKKKKDFPR